MDSLAISEELEPEVHEYVNVDEHRRPDPQLRAERLGPRVGELVNAASFSEVLRWYFPKTPRIFLTLPLFLILAINVLGYVFWAVGDIIAFFQVTTWGGIGLVLFFPVLLGLFFVPAWLNYIALMWLYGVHVATLGPWKKLFATLGLLALAVVGGAVARMIILAVFF